MSKKLYSLQRFKAHVRRRQVDELRRLRRRQKKRRPQDAELQPVTSARLLRKKHARPYTHIEAPSVFSLVENPEEVVLFLRNLVILSRTHHISLDLRGVAALLATIQQDPIRSDTNVRGNLPDDRGARETLIQSGFFDYVRSTQRLPAVSKGQISQKKSQKVEARLARDLIHLGTKAIHGEARRCQPAYRVLIESMNNTHNHAAGSRSDRETWWATVYADMERQRVCYTFLDTGVGIFRSVKVSLLRKMYKLLGAQHDSDILRDLLEGRVESRTGKPYRGKGLPAIYAHSRRGTIRSLVIIANDVYANVEKDEYQPMRCEFGGTLLYWET